MQFKRNWIIVDVTKIGITYKISLSVRWAANILITIAVLVFLKLATLLYKNVEN